MYSLPYSSHTYHHPWISFGTQKLMLHSCKMVEKQSEAFYTFLWHFFPSLKQNFIAYRSSSRPDCIFEIHQQWQSGFSWVYSNSCCSCSFEPEIIKIGRSTHKVYSNKILNYPETTPILNACIKKSGNWLNVPRTSDVLIPPRRICLVLMAWDKKKKKEEENLSSLGFCCPSR